MPLLTTPADLAELTAAEDAPVRVLDVRWRLDAPDGRIAYRAGHIPGAVYVDLDHELSTPGAPQDGRHPVPGHDTLQAAARRWGVSNGDTVIVYDDAGSVAAARAWWLLSRSGISDVRVLDGGLRAWTGDGRALEEGQIVPAPGDVDLEPLRRGLDIDEAAAWPQDGVLLDVRAPERYRGETEPMDPLAGHIPGAVNLPTPSFADAGRFRSPEELRAAFAGAGARDGVPVAAYCGSGIAASHAALAGALAGIEVTVYPGSWSQWSQTPGRPVATGEEPNGGAPA